MLNLKFRANQEVTLECNKEHLLDVKNVGILKGELDSQIESDSILGNAGVISSDAEYNSGVFEYEVNLFDFAPLLTYEEIEVCANRFVTDIEATYSNVRGYTLGKFVSGNSFGIKIVIMIFKV